MEILEELKASFQEFKEVKTKADANVDKLIKDQQAGIEQNSGDLKQALKDAEALTTKVQDVSDRLVEAEQKLVEGIKAGKEAPKSLGVLVIESDEYKAFASRKTNSMSISLDVQANTLSGQGGSPVANEDTLVPKQRIPGIIPGAFRRLRVRDIIPAGNTGSNLVEFTRELAFTNNAAETAEAATKPESSLTFELANAPVVTIAHWLKVTSQIRDDAPALMSYIDTRLRYGVELREDQQLVAGNGVGQNLIGMTVAPNFTAFTPISGDTALDSINRAKYIIDVADYMATAVILNPVDWGNIERSKDSQLRYIVGDPQSAIGPFLWGLPVVVTNSMTAGKILIGAFDIAFQYWLRKEVVVQLSESDDTNFQKNLVTIRAEKRAALAGYRPASVLHGSLTL